MDKCNELKMIGDCLDNLYPAIGSSLYFINKKFDSESMFKHGQIWESTIFYQENFVVMGMSPTAKSDTNKFGPVVTEIPCGIV
jgi:hypothetical protein